MLAPMRDVCFVCRVARQDEMQRDLCTRPVGKRARRPCLDGDGEPLGAETPGHSLGSANEFGGGRARTHADQQAFVGRPRYLRRPLLPGRIHIAPKPIGGLTERQFAQGDEVGVLKKIL